MCLGCEVFGALRCRSVFGLPVCGSPGCPCRTEASPFLRRMVTATAPSAFFPVWRGSPSPGFLMETNALCDTLGPWTWDVVWGSCPAMLS